LALGVACAATWSQDPKQALQQRLAEVKQTLAQSQAQLKSYEWVETTEVSLKGEVKKRVQNECRYGPDGKVQKTPVGGEPEENGGKKRGLKGRAVAKKVDELKEYMERFGSLIGRYVPPEAQLMQQAFQAGTVSIDRPAEGSVAALVFNDYIKPGDKVKLTVDTAAKALRGYDVATYLDDPADKASLTTRFSSLADGTNYLEETVLVSESKKLQIKTVNFGHRKTGQ
jgi:hypothetical protein